MNQHEIDRLFELLESLSSSLEQIVGFMGKIDTSQKDAHLITSKEKP